MAERKIERRVNESKGMERRVIVSCHAC